VLGISSSIIHETQSTLNPPTGVLRALNVSTASGISTSGLSFYVPVLVNQLTSEEMFVNHLISQAGQM
jgi:hypothetical protein